MIKRFTDEGVWPSTTTPPTTVIFIVGVAGDEGGPAEGNGEGMVIEGVAGDEGGPAEGNPRLELRVRAMACRTQE